MAGIGDFVNLKGLNAGNASEKILDLIFGKNCILLKDVGLIFGLPTGIPCPLIGFEYEMPDKMPLLDFSYSDYPYLNRTALTNAFFKNNVRFQLKAHRPITPRNKFIINYAINEAIYTTLDKYVSNGGLFLVLTPWGALNNCALEKFSGFKSSPNEIGGQGFIFDFLKVNMPSDLQQAKQNAMLSAITGGGVI